jgi:hypothetical protein
MDGWMDGCIDSVVLYVYELCIHFLCGWYGTYLEVYTSQVKSS